jgi:hypothetical protein
LSVRHSTLPLQNLTNNIRRKKTRCSGERPVCSFCSRLRQNCRYNDSYIAEVGESSIESNLQQENAGLATRVALLESRLSLMDASGSNGATVSSLFGNTSTSVQSALDSGVSSSDLTFLLDSTTLQSLADVSRWCMSCIYGTSLTSWLYHCRCTFPAATNRCTLSFTRRLSGGILRTRPYHPTSC